MRKNVVLIDFENVQPDSIEALDHEHFQVLLFCGASQTKVPLEVASTLQKFGTRAQYIRIAGTGPNALDFHIAYYIGRLSSEDPGTFFHIVSRDKGFDPLIQYLKAKRILAVRSTSISEIPIVKNGVLRTPTEKAEAFIAKLMQPKVTKPRTEKTMSSAIKAHFQPLITEPEVAEVLQAMVARTFIAVENGKIVYAQADA